MIACRCRHGKIVNWIDIIDIDTVDFADYANQYTLEVIDKPVVQACQECKDLYEQNMALLKKESKLQ